MKPAFIYLSDDQWSRMALNERCLYVARAMEKNEVREELGPNKGKWVNRFLAFVGLKPGYAWCAAFVAWCLGQSGLDKSKMPKHSPSVIGWYRWAKANDRLTGVPKRGRLFYWLDGSHGHIGFIIGLSAGCVQTLEGNTNKQGSRDGDGVYQRTRSYRELESHEKHGFITLSDL